MTFLKLISVAIFFFFFFIYSSAGYGFCTLTTRRRIVLAPPPPPHKPYQFFISLSLELHLLDDYTTSKIVAVQVMIFTQFTCGKYRKSDLHADFVRLIFRTEFRTYGNTNIKNRLIRFCDGQKSSGQSPSDK